MLRPGDILAGKYEIIKLIGKGGMSKVWLAEDTNERLHKYWAVKEISKTTEAYRKNVDEKKSLHEIEILKSLDHPALPRIVDVIDSDTSLCVVMDHISGPNLQVVLEEYGTQKEQAVVAWMLEVCDILTYLHSQNPPIIYRDIKPSNLMINTDGHIKIIDFGIAREYTGGEDTAPLGSKAYASPEHSTRHTDERSDIYTVGTTAYALLTGKTQAMPPYYIQPLRKIDPSLSQGLEKIILKATREDPAERYQTAAELANALESYEKLDDEYIGGLQKVLSGYKRKIIAASAVALIGLTVTASGFAYERGTYNSLVSSTGGKPETTIANLQKAIEIKPSEEEAYIALIETYSSDGKFTEKESEQFYDVYNRNINYIDGDSSYAIGEAYLRYYTGETDSSARAKLLTAEPFFKAAEKEGSHKDIAADYVFLAEYHKTYIMSDDSLLTGTGTKDDYEKMLATCRDAVSEAEDEKLRSIMAEASISLINSQCREMKTAGISQEELEHTIDVAAKGLAAEDRSFAQSTKEEINRLYHPKEEGGTPVVAEGEATQND